MNRRRVLFGVVAAAVLVGLTVTTVKVRSYWASYRVECEPAKHALMKISELPGDRLDKYLETVRFVDGGAVEADGHHYLYTVAMIGLLNIKRYCQTGEARRLEMAISQREFLAKNLDHYGSGVFKHNFPNLPYADKPDWGSSMSQSTGTLLMMLLHPVRNMRDRARIESTIKAALRPIDQDGLYSNFENGTLFWEEVAWPGRPSLIINGAQIATHYYDRIIPLLRDGDPNKPALMHLNERAKDGIMLVQERMLAGDGKPGNILYDLTTVPTNVRPRGHYAHTIAIEWLEEMKGQGRDVRDYIERLVAP